MIDNKYQNLDDIDDIEEKIKREEKERITKKEMLVSGKSVFEIKRLKDKGGRLTNKDK